MCENGVWYKADYLGYEAASEYEADFVLEGTVQIFNLTSTPSSLTFTTKVQ